MERSVSFKNYFIVPLSIAVIVSCSGCDIYKAIFNKPKKTEVVSQEATVVKQEAPAVVSEGMAADVLAQVGSWKITTNEFKERLNAVKEVVPDFNPDDLESKKMVLDELVRQQLVVMDADQSGLSKQKDILDAVEEFRRSVIVREVTRKLVENVNVTEEEAKAFYEAQKANLIKPVEWHIREIVVEDQLKANEMLTEVLKGSDFAEMARQNSKGKTAAQGGDLGFISQEPFAEMAPIILALEVGKTSNVFKGPEGFYIVKLEEKKGGEQISYNEIKQDIDQKLKADKQQQVILDYLKKLEEKVQVKINNDLLK